MKTVINITLLILFGTIEQVSPVGNYHENNAFILSKPRTFQVERNGQVLLPCKVKNLGAMVVIWKFGTRVLTAGNLKIKKDSRLRLLYTDLMLSNVTSSDVGLYTCEVETDRDIPLKLTHKINVLVSPTLEIDDGPNDLTVMKGSTLTLNCKAKGFPTPRIDWTRSSGHVPLELLSYDRTFLTLTNISRYDAGDYICTAHNGVGYPARNVVQLSVKYSPEVVSEKMIVHTGVGQTSEISCNIYSSPTGSVSWFKDSALLHQDNNTYFRSKENLYTLGFKNITEYHFGNYTCVATNIYGKAESTIFQTGVPETPIFLDDQELNGGIDTLVWSCLSYSPIIKYRLQYRLKKGANVVPWFQLVLLSHDSPRNHVYTLKHTIENLWTPGVYESRLQAYNRFGWSSQSRLFNFTAYKPDNQKSLVKPLMSDNPKTQLMLSSSNSTLQLSTILLQISIIILRIIRH